VRSESWRVASLGGEALFEVGDLLPEPDGHFVAELGEVFGEVGDLGLAGVVVARLWYAGVVSEAAVEPMKPP